MQRAIFLDRDGVINRVVKKFSRSYGRLIDDSPFSVSELRFTPGIKELIEAFRKKYKFIVVTNQPSIIKGEFSLRDYEDVTTQMCTYLSLERSAVFECFHKEGISLECLCRKPRPGLIYMAAGLHNIAIQDSCLIGDSWKDIQAAKAAKIPLTIYIRRKEDKTQFGNADDEALMNEKELVPDYFINNLFEAISILSLKDK